jgi:hypothetical protein
MSNIKNKLSTHKFAKLVINQVHSCKGIIIFSDEI